MVVQNSCDGIRIHANHALEVVGLHILRALEKRIICVLVECSEVEKLGHGVAAGGGEGGVFLLEDGEASEEGL
jgi:hypothetical protein